MDKTNETNEITNKIENFNTEKIVDSCHFVCSNLSTINIVLIVMMIILLYMYMG